MIGYETSEIPCPFIVGVPRSGTTLLRLMLDAHPLMAIPAESHFIPHVAELRGPSEELRKVFVKTLVTFPTFPDLAITPEELQEAIAQLPHFTVADGVRAFFSLYAHTHGKARWGDKSPPYLSAMDVISRLLPEAHFVHIIRDGRDVAVSIRHLWFRPGETVEAIVSDWRQRILRARVMSQQLQHYLEVRYEDLIRDPEEVLMRIGIFIKLPYDPKMLTWHRTAAMRLDEVQTRYREDGSVLITKAERLFNQRYTAQPPSPERIGRWRRELTREESRTFERIAGLLLEELGYDV